MKKILFCLALTAAALSCDRFPDGPCGLNGRGSAMTGLRVEICNGDVPVKQGETVSSANMVVKLLCEITTIEGTFYTKGGTYGGCPERENVGLDPEFRGITLTCDRTIANIEAGDDLIAVLRPRVKLKNRGDWSIEEWKGVLNNGFISDPGSPGSLIHGTVLPPNMTYEFDIALLPYFVTVAEGDYIFTVKIDLGWDTLGNNSVYTRTFPAVHLK
jgi:hypothetical protein